MQHRRSNRHAMTMATRQPWLPIRDVTCHQSRMARPRRKDTGASFLVLYVAVCAMVYLAAVLLVTLLLIV